MLRPYNRTAIERGQFPLRYDTVVKIYYPLCEMINWSYFVCQSKDIATIVEVLSGIVVIGHVDFIPVDEFNG